MLLYIVLISLLAEFCSKQVDTMEKGDRLFGNSSVITHRVHGFWIPSIPELLFRDAFLKSDDPIYNLHSYVRLAVSCSPQPTLAWN